MALPATTTEPSMMPASLVESVTHAHEARRVLGILDELLHQVEPCYGMVVGSLGQACLFGGRK